MSDRIAAPRRVGRRSLRALAAGVALSAAGALAATGVTTATAPTARAATTSSCTLSAKLVPSCSRLWGAAPAAFDYSSSDQTQAKRFESLMRRPMDIWHSYRTNGQLFPNQDDRAVAANAGGRRRLLFFNWRPATDYTWAQTASGRIDGRIDRLASYIKANYTRPFFMSIWHEPEHFVNPTTGSGMTASDYRAMVRHVILRLKKDGVSNVVFVQIFQGYPAYAVKSWWPQLYPGDDVIDWIAEDSYNSGSSTGYNSGDFGDMVNRTKDNWPGFYKWATSQHPGKPLMLGEWGVYYKSSEPARQGWFFDDVRNNLSKYPALKAMMYFNANRTPKGTTRIDANANSLAAFQRLSNSIPLVKMP